VTNTLESGSFPTKADEESPRLIQGVGKETEQWQVQNSGTVVQAIHVIRPSVDGPMCFLMCLTGTAGSEGRLQEEWILSVPRVSLKETVTGLMSVPRVSLKKMASKVDRRSVAEK
jgi:hypothetical protein